MKRRDHMDRRDFVRSAAMASAGILASGRLVGAARGKPATGKVGPDCGKPFCKAVKYGMVAGNDSILDKFKLLKELGFDGVEMDSPSGLDPKEVCRARDESGLLIPGVVDSVHWKQAFSDPDPKVRAEGVAALKTALRDAKTYGATTVLVVPAVVDKKVPYDDAYKRSQEEIRKALPVAQETGVKIAIENVWNNFLLSPMEAARYVDEFQSPMVGWHFDVGNIVRSGWPEHWIHILGKRILKLDIKEYSRTGKGFDVELLEGDCDWPAVMKALRDIGYSGWAAAEINGGGRDRLKEIATRMDRIFAS